MKKIITILLVLFLNALNVPVFADHYAYAVSILDDGKNPAYQKYYTLIRQNKNAELKRLLTQEGNADTSNAKRASLIHVASHFGNIHALRLLIQNGANIQAATFGGWSALHYAAFAGHAQIANTLIAMGLDVSNTDAGGETSLFYAIESGNMNTVKTLVEQGADIQHNNGKGDTPLSIAQNHGQKSIEEYLRLHIKKTENTAVAAKQKATDGHNHSH